MENTALLIAAVSLLVAGLSLGWQVAQWLLSAARPKATLLHGLVDGSGAYSGPVPRSGRLLNIGQLRGQGIDGVEVLGIQVTNHGRAPMVIDRIALCPRGGVMTYVPHGDLIGEQLPCRVEPGSNASWFVNIAAAAALASTSREVLHEAVTGVYVRALLGTGKSVRTRRTLAI